MTIKTKQFIYNYMVYDGVLIKIIDYRIAQFQ